jgi:hypothetical protein
MGIIVQLDVNHRERPQQARALVGQHFALARLPLHPHRHELVREAVCSRGRAARKIREAVSGGSTREGLSKEPLG